MATRLTPEEMRNTALAVALGLVLAAVLVLASRPSEARPESTRRGLPTGVPMQPFADGREVRTPPPVFLGAPPMLGKAQRLTADAELRIVGRARDEVNRVTTYDNTYMATDGYPMGDVPANRGACTDVVVRSLRDVGVDLQQLVHEDIESDLRGYGQSSADPHIDHRRVGTMMTFFQRHAMTLTNDPKDPNAFRPGDIVFYAWTWAKGAPPEHVGIVSDRRGPRGLYLVIQNGGPKPIENDTLDHGRMVGHFRALPAR